MRPRISPHDRAIKLATLEPLWAAYVPSSNAYWASVAMPNTNPEAAFNMPFWNPICFAATAGLVVIGGFRRMLNRYDLAIGFCVLFIPYLTRGYDFGMGSQARFATLCYPAMLVLGRMLLRLPPVWRAVVLLPAVAQMTLWAALFGQGYPLF